MKKILSSFLMLSIGLFATEALTGAVEKQPLNVSAIIMFLVFVAGTLGITYWAAKRTKSAKDFYTAGGGITGFQNGLAIAGDYMSAASFLGISALVYGAGYDGLIYSIGFLVGWPLILFLMSERLRNLGKYTFADVVAYRLRQGPIRSMAAAGAIVTVILYLIAQMVGAGKLIQLLFGLPYSWAVVIVGGLMMLYVTFGGMLATTWVQIIKAFLLLSGATFIALAVLVHFGFSFEAMFKSATLIHAKHDAIMSPGALVPDAYSAISLGLALMLGTAGLPHILMRFFTVADAKEARKSVFYATGFIGYFYILTFIIGFGAISILALHPEYFNGGVAAIQNGIQTIVSDENASKILIGDKKALIGGSDMAAIRLAHAVGGNFFLGFISAVAFATILAVVSGLTLAGASAISHDLYANVFRRGRVDEATEMKVSKIATIGLGIIAIFLGIVFEEQNIAFMVGLAFAIAASANFPVLFLAMFWKNLTTRGAVVGGLMGLFTAVILVILSPVVWVDVFKNAEAIFPYKYPALISVSVAFISIWLFSITDKSKSAASERDAFDAQNVRSQTGIGAEGASSH